MFASGDGDVYVWDVNSRSCLARHGDQGGVHGTQVAVSKDCQYYATGSDSGVVSVYDGASAWNGGKAKLLKNIMSLTTKVDHVSAHPGLFLLLVFWHPYHVLPFNS